MIISPSDHNALSRQVSLMIKPVGAACNLACGYCYYRSAPQTAAPGRMDAAVLEALLAGYLPQGPDETAIVWQGGEPLLAGIDFFENAVRLQERFRRPNQIVANILQTNGTLIDRRWCEFFRKNNFLVGISIDGDLPLHDGYRRDPRGGGSLSAVLAGLDLLRLSRVPFNILCVVHERNVGRPRELLKYLQSLGSPWLQFIPAVEWREESSKVKDFVPETAAYGRFLCETFDLWFEKYRDTLTLRHVEALLEKLVLGRGSLCTQEETCPPLLTVEKDGSVYACDHFVAPQWRLGTVADGPAGEEWLHALAWENLSCFRERKTRIAEGCAACPWLPFCHGGCPKHAGPDGVNVLCEAYRTFIPHAMPRLEWLAGHVRRGMAPPPPDRAGAGAGAGKAPCPCGSGRKFKRCCGRK